MSQEPAAMRTHDLKSGVSSLSFHRRFCLALAVSFLLTHGLAAGADQVPGIAKRAPWTTSHVQGSPDPPLPYQAQRVFPLLAFNHPTVLTGAPGTERLFVAEQAGKIYSFPDDQNCRQADLFLDVAELTARLNASLNQQDQVNLEAVYGLTFHPQFARNGKCYVCYVVRYRDGGRGQHPHGTRVVELQIEGNDPPQALVESEKVIITWLQGGHNGGCIKFGHDGMLYISTGDGGFAFPPDGRNSGQDVSNLLAAVLRIDVDETTETSPYAIPADNPFISMTGARGEIFAYGMRNPWKMSFDKKTGQLWVGDVGWELWELIYRVKPGDNYGWSLMEGRQPVHSERERGPTPIVPPAIEIPHTEAASITGGFVYRGQRLPELQGHYIFGDWETRRFWAVSVAAETIGQRTELVEPTVRIVGFAEKNDGELLLLDYDTGSIHELARRPIATDTNTPFPRRLSETGLFDSLTAHTPTRGVVPFSINAPMWTDLATAERWLGLPGDASIVLHNESKTVAGSMFRRRMDFPTDSVLMKTLSLELVLGDPATKRKIETQLLHFNGYDWRGYSYRWNAEQTDAELVEAAGATATFDITDKTAPGGQRRQTWRFHSRADCIRCHNPWAEFCLAFNVAQLNRPSEVAGIQTGNDRENHDSLNQLDKLFRLGVLRHVPPQVAANDPFAVVEQPLPPDQQPRLSDPYDQAADLDHRARAYLHVNCAHCHRFNGGGAAKIYVPFDKPIYQTEALGTRPTQGTFGIHDAMIIAPGDPHRSVLYFRMAKAGPGHMPHLGSQFIDRQGLALIRDWIHELPPDIEIAEKIDQLIGLDESLALQEEKKNQAMNRWKIARQIAVGEQREIPTQADMDAAQERAAADAQKRSATRGKRREELIGQLLADPRGAIALADAERDGRLPPTIVSLVNNTAAKHDNIAVRDLFESLLPDDQKIERLGDSIDAEKLLQLAGDPTRGKELFFNAEGIQCRHCHRVGELGKPLGPDLTEIAKRLDRAKLLESLLEPSKTIDPKYAAWLIETSDGKVVSGLLVRKTNDEIVIRDTQNRELRFDTAEIEGVFPQRTSLMPDRLLRDLTAQQAADLLSWLESLK